MNMHPVQVPSIILPRVAPLGTEVEMVADLNEHTSIEFDCTYLQEKQIHILAMEVVAVGVPGNLLCWVELSPVATPISGNYWAAIGGGGGAQPPLAPAVIVGTGVNLTQHTIILPWTQHSVYARVVVRTPVAAALPLAYWVVQVIVAGKR